MRTRPRLRVGIRAQMVVLFMAFYTLQGCGKVLLKYVYTWAAALEKGGLLPLVAEGVWRHCGGARAVGWIKLAVLYGWILLQDSSRGSLSP